MRPIVSCKISGVNGGFHIPFIFFAYILAMLPLFVQCKQDYCHAKIYFSCNIFYRSKNPRCTKPRPVLVKSCFWLFLIFPDNLPCFCRFLLLFRQALLKDAFSMIAFIEKIVYDYYLTNGHILACSPCVGLMPMRFHLKQIGGKHHEKTARIPARGGYGAGPCGLRLNPPILRLRPRKRLLPAAT